MFNKILAYLRSKSTDITYYYPQDEKEFEKNQTKIRTSEVSEFQDEARDIETRSPERTAYEAKVPFDELNQ